MRVSHPINNPSGSLMQLSLCFRLKGIQCHYHSGKYISEVGMSGSLAAKVEDMGVVGEQTENR